MNTYNIIWYDLGSMVRRNNVVEDPRPMLIEADDYELISGPNEELAGVKFFRGDNTEPYLCIFDVPLMITRVGA